MHSQNSFYQFINISSLCVCKYYVYRIPNNMKYIYLNIYIFMLMYNNKNIEIHNFYESATCFIFISYHQFKYTNEGIKISNKHMREKIQKANFCKYRDIIHQSFTIYRQIFHAFKKFLKGKEWTILFFYILYTFFLLNYINSIWQSDLEIVEISRRTLPLLFVIIFYVSRVVHKVIRVFLGDKKSGMVGMWFLKKSKNIT